MNRTDIEKLDFTNPHDKALLCAYLCTISYQDKASQEKWLGSRFDMSFFESDTCYDTLQYFMVYDEKAKMAYVVIRGTDIKRIWKQWKDLGISLRVWPKKVKNTKGHNGYVRAGNAIIRQIEKSISNAEKSGYKVIMTGHSMGGVLSKYIACMLNKRIEVYTFGAPCLVKSDFYDDVSNVSVYKYRMQDDMIPLFPSLLYDDVFGDEYMLARGNIHLDSEKRGGFITLFLYLSKIKIFFKAISIVKSHSMKYYTLNLLRKHKNNNENK